MKLKDKLLLGLLGEVSGMNSQARSDEILIEDLNFAKKDIKLVSNSSQPIFWSELGRNLQYKLDALPRLHIKILAGPHAPIPALEDLRDQGRLNVFRLLNDPKVECRIIDSYQTYISNEEKYSWTSGNVKAVADRLQYFNSLK